MTGPHTSMYGRDVRVQWPRDGWHPNWLAYLPDPSDRNNDRVVEIAGGAFVVRGATNGYATLMDPSDKYQQKILIFSSVDEAIFAVIGEPLVSALSVEELAAAFDAGLPPGQQIECQLVLHQDAHSRQTQEATARIVWQGGSMELRSWPATHVGLAEAGAWAVGHAAFDTAGYRIENPNIYLHAANPW